MYSGPYQNETSGDEVWDHPYIIDDNNKDRYPLVEPWTPILGDVNGDGMVDASDLFDLSKAYGCVLGDDKWNPACDFNCDGKVDASDLFDLSENYGKIDSEVSLGTFVASASMILAFVVCVAVPRWRRKQKYVDL